MISKPQLKFIRSLQQKKFRDIHDAYVAEGHHIVSEAMKMVPEAIQMLIYTTKTLPQISDHLKTVKDRSYCVSSKEFSQISTQKSPQEILAVIQMSRPTPPADPKDQLILVLDSIRDPGNMGTIIRLADWFGIHDIVCSEDSVDHFNPKVVQSSMGAIFRIHVSHTDLSSYLSDLRKKADIPVYGTAMSGKNIFETSLKSPGIIILGNEATGISDKIMQLCNDQVMIPNFSTSKDKSESLNVAVAAAIFCAEFRRQNS